MLKKTVLLCSCFFIANTLFSQTGRILGKVINSKGERVPKAKLVLRLASRNLSKTIVADDKGNFFQVGLEPQLFEITTTADGYQPTREQVKIDLSEPVQIDIKLYRLGEERPSEMGGVRYGATAVRDVQNEAFVKDEDAGSAAISDPAMKLDAESRELFNLGLPFYKEKNYKAAVELFSKAYQGMNSAVESMKEESAKNELLTLLPKVKKAYAISLYNAGSTKEGAVLLAEIADSNTDNKSNADIFDMLVRHYESLKDNNNAAKYRAALEKAVGPRSDLAYNDAVAAFNEGRSSEARAKVLKAISADPNFAEAYWLLGMIEYGSGNIGAAKTHFKKYLALEPNGKYAKDIKQELGGM
ncbi:MAG: carboxypeptidase regulatory-like domain-containing protein [Holophagaceae bacterium]|jgi:Tfp pilus assembly protein PilF